MSQGLLNPARQYAGMKFPEYVYQEYPKMLYLKGGTVQLIVHNKHEEIQALANDGDKPTEMSPLEIEREALVQEVGRLQAELNAAKAVKAAPVTPVATKAKP